MQLSTAPVPHAYSSVVLHDDAHAHLGDVHYHHSAQTDPSIFKKNNYNAFREANPRRVPGTCNWVLNHPRFKLWRDRPDSRLLWISADPGCGKSVLARAIIDEDLATSGVSADDSTRYLFHFFKDVGTQHSAATALSSILHQLYSRDEVWAQCRPHVARLIFLHGQSVLDEVSELWSLLLTSIRLCSPSKFICVIDALDECRHEDRRLLIQELESFSTSSVQPQIKFLITSRPYHQILYDFQQMIDHIPTIHLAGEEESDHIKAEIDVVMHAMIESLATRMSLTWQLKSALLRRLRRIEHRTYLWLSLMVKEIERLVAPSERELLSQVEVLPETIEEIYERLLVQSANRSAAREILGLVAISHATLTLNELELLFQIRGTKATINDLEFRGSARFKTFARNSCGLFLVIVDDRVYLIHQTVKEFLLWHQDLSPRSWVFRGSVDPAQDHPRMAVKCMLALKLVGESEENLRLMLIDHNEWREPSTYGYDTFLKTFPALRYPIKHWIDHLRECERNSPQLALTLFRGFAANISYDSYIGQMLYRTITPPHGTWSPRTHIVAELDDLLDCEGEYDPSQWPKSKSVPYGTSIDALVFVLAVAHGFMSTARVLFDMLNFAHPDFQRLRITALRLLTLTSNSDLLRSLLVTCSSTIESMVNTAGPTSRTPLSYSLDVFRAKGQSGCLSLLVNAGAKVTPRVQQDMDSCYTPELTARLLGSDGRDDGGVLRMLLRAGLDPATALLKFVEKEDVNGLLVLTHDPAFRLKIQEAIPQDLRNGSGIVGFTKQQRERCDFFAEFIPERVLEATAKGFLQGADRLIDTITVGGRNCNKCCCLCYTFRCFRYTYDRNFDHTMLYLRRQSPMCCGLGPLLNAAARDDSAAVRKLLQQYDSLRHSQHIRLSVSWSALLAVAHDYIDTLTALHEYVVQTRLILHVGDTTIVLTQALVNACSVRRQEISREDPILHDPNITENIAQITKWTLETTKVLLTFTEPTIIPEVLFTSEAATILSKSLDYVDSEQTAQDRQHRDFNTYMSESVMEDVQLFERLLYEEVEDEVDVCPRVIDDKAIDGVNDGYEID